MRLAELQYAMIDFEEQEFINRVRSYYYRLAILFPVSF